MKTHGEFNPSRRQLFTGASAIAAAGLVGSALPAAAKAPLLKTQAPAFYRFNVGGFEATVVSDGLSSACRRPPSSVRRPPTSKR